MDGILVRISGRKANFSIISVVSSILIKVVGLKYIANLESSWVKPTIACMSTRSRRGHYLSLSKLNSIAERPNPVYLDFHDCSWNQVLRRL